MKISTILDRIASGHMALPEPQREDAYIMVWNQGDVLANKLA